MGNAVVRVNGTAFTVEGALGEGGFSRVLRVRRGGEWRALKWSRGVSGREELERARLEITVQRQLRHANCLRLDDAEVRVDKAAPAGDGRSEEAMEVLMLFPLLPKGSLQAYLEQAAAAHRVAFSERECLRFFLLLLDAVQALHDLGYAHRDIKPSNVLLSDTTPVEPVLMDFGSVAPLSCAINTFSDARRECEAAAQYSSAAYRAPELWEAGAATFRGTIDGRADVWSLGCVLYAMAFGPFSPFEDPRDGVQQLAILSGNVSFESRSHARAYSPTFTALMRWILTPDIVERPTLDGVRQCVRQLQSIPPAPLRRMSSAVPPLQLVRQLSKQESWADFASFEASMETESVPDSKQTLSRQTSSWGGTPTDRTRRTSRPAEVNGAIVEPVAVGNDSQQRRALSRTGRQMLKHALSDPSIT